LPSGGPSPTALAVIVVARDAAGELKRLTDVLLPQLADDDELVVVDNGSRDGTSHVARSLSPRVAVIEIGVNLGFAAGARAGAAATHAPLLLLLNPDCRPQPHALERLRAVAADRPDWAAWQAAVMLPDGRINSSGGVVHYLGMGWAGDCGRPAAELPSGQRGVAFPSGAAMVIRRSEWEELDGLEDSYFTYGEDLDLGLRLWLAGRTVGVEPAARVTHDYDFDKGADKWFWLERNRWRTVLAVYPAPLLALLAPALLASEAALIALAASEGWLRAKLRAQAAALRDVPRTLRRRRRVQALRRVPAAEFAAHLTASLENPYLPSGWSWAQRAQAAYWAGVRRLLGLR
jgi:GT2 family glycosyltransferase